MGFQYREPSEDDAFMKEDEYDQLIDDPTAFLYNVWLPRVSTEIVAAGRAELVSQQSRAGQGRHGHVELLHGLRRRRTSA